MGPLRLRVEIEHWPRSTPVRITGYTYDVINVVLLTLEKDGHVGRAEAGGVFYLKDTAETMLQQLEAVRTTIEAGIDRERVQTLLPAGGARNALDCALWDLESKLTGRPVWQLAGLDPPRPVLTVFTCHADEPEKMAARARGYHGAKAIKLKLTGEPIDKARIQAVRDSLPDVWLGVDANQGFTRESLEALMPALLATRVALIEQPFPLRHDAWLDSFHSPIPIAADESLQGIEQLAGLAGRFAIANIKLDKCGGLTEALAMARRAQAEGLEPMVGNMSGTSLAMAPAFLVGQLCKFADLDGPVFLKSDRPVTVRYADGYVSCPDALWGHA
jgi:L-alanine-DL-glutamate epimerase-like enolase superfamily enzyme